GYPGDPYGRHREQCRRLRPAAIPQEMQRKTGETPAESLPKPPCSAPFVRPPKRPPVAITDEPAEYRVQPDTEKQPHAIGGCRPHYVRGRMQHAEEQRVER